MSCALELAQKGVGLTSPNPAVGAVVVKEGTIVGEGYHHRCGEAHAEILALAEAGRRSEGATLYVTLEPCCHTGKTPPCAQAILRAGIKRVVYAIDDPNPSVNGGGHQQLLRGGVEVSRGVQWNEAESLNRGFFHRMRFGMPYVVLKYAMSLDGKIATHRGKSKWITQVPSRSKAHELRFLSDAILVGKHTVQQDDPLLTIRYVDDHGKRPLRLVVDSQGRLDPKQYALFQREDLGSVWWVTGPAKVEHTFGEHVRHLPMDLDEEGRVDLTGLWKRLAAAGINTLMVEGGGSLAGSIMEQGLAQEVWAFIGATVLGGQKAPGPIGGIGFGELSEAGRWQLEKVEQIGQDVLIIARRFDQFFQQSERG
jgi:diaminohydroxyphosphoribosylaminopyrimidine deaminase/5-amino-6-(5-phosphoribosylamino)uracil reductase